MEWTASLMSYGFCGSAGTRVLSDSSRRAGGSEVARRGGSSKLFEGRKLISSRIMARQSASSRETKWATPLVALCVIAPPSSCLVTSSCVTVRSEEHTSELQSRVDLVCRLLLEEKK